MENCSQAGLPRYNYGEGIQTIDSITVDSSHTYNVAGIYDVSQYIGTSQIVGLTQKKLIRAVSDTKPLFSINYCKDYIIQLVFNPDNLYDKYLINYDDGTSIDTVLASITPSKQYLNGNARTITITGIYNNAPCSNSNTLTATPQKDLTLPSFKTLTTITTDSLNGENELDISPSPFFRNTLLYSKTDFNFTPLDTFITSTPDTLLNQSGLNNLTSSFCYNFKTFDYCSNEIFGDTVCSFSLISEAENNRNTNSWNIYPLIENITDLRFIKNSDTTTLSKNINNSIDSNVVCANNYCYQLTTLHTSGTQVFSNTVCLNSFSTDIPDPISDFKASTEKGEIILSWKSPSPYIVKTSLLQKAIDNSVYEDFATILDFDSIYNDQVSSTPTCYIINYIDACDNTSETTLADTSCYIILEVEKIHETEYSLSWTNFIGFENAIYTLQYLDENNSPVKEIPLNTSPYLDNSPIETFQTLNYRIKVTGDNDSSFSNVVSFELKSRIFIPNAFSPNGDDNQDYFLPDTRFIQEYTLTIYNRWGEQIYNDSNSEIGWDGKYKGKLVAVDSYIYLLEGIDDTGEKILKKGTVTVYY